MTHICYLENFITNEWKIYGTNLRGKITDCKFFLIKKKKRSLRHDVNIFMHLRLSKETLTLAVEAEALNYGSLREEKVQQQQFFVSHDRKINN